MELATDRAETTVCTRGDTLRISRRMSETAMTPIVSRAVRRARGGDREALRFLYARYADDVYGCVHALVDDHDRARDVTQRVFSRLERLIEYYQEPDGPFGVWIRQVARIAAGDVRLSLPAPAAADDPWRFRRRDTRA